MIIPQYWAEARLQHRERKRQVTVRRFGWSDISLEAAQTHADARVREAMERVLAGERLPRRERRAAYNGAEGVPIREQIVSRDGDCVISRNSYGALCLNTPNVLFADIDFETEPSLRMSLAVWISLGLAAGLTFKFGLDKGLWGSVVVGFCTALVLGHMLTARLQRARIALAGGHEAMARKRITAFLSRRPEWRLRLYRTPAGLRLLALHRLFDPREGEVEEAFQALGADRTYAQMCRNQNCFRARVSPKPWRLGLQRLRAPYSAAWRLEHAELPARIAWIAEYDRASDGHAACRFIEALGQGRIDPAAEHVQHLHDRMSKAARDLPLA